jgi:hypothetical protein
MCKAFGIHAEPVAQATSEGTEGNQDKTQIV